MIKSCRDCLYRYKLLSGTEICKMSWKSEDVVVNSERSCLLWVSRYDFVDK